MMRYIDIEDREVTDQKSHYLVFEEIAVKGGRVPPNAKFKECFLLNDKEAVRYFYEVR